MRLIVSIILIVSGTCTWAQGGWIKDTNPANDVTTYTTIYPYVGASFVDLSGDNYVDIFAPPVSLFINNGNGTFSEITSLQFAPGLGISGSSCADLDNDGDNDIVVACVPSKIFFNDGSGGFSDSSSQVPSFVNYGSWAVAIGNYNNDKELDFIFAYSNGYHPGSIPSPCRFYHLQLPTFHPVETILHPLTDSLNTYTNPYWSDYDIDGDMDLFMASGSGTGTPLNDFYYKNLRIELGVDSMVPMTTELFATQMQDGRCYSFMDYDNDLDLDICLTNYYSAPTRLYRNDDSTYTEIITPFSTATTNVANCWGDYDNDGDQDVIITNTNDVSKYYRNDGTNFTYLPGGFSTLTATNGIANADYDNDGDLDVFTNGIGTNGNTTSVGLYINDTVAGNRNFVNLQLVGTSSNRSAIGSIIQIKSTINGNPTWQMRELNAQNTYQGQNDMRIHFGLGNSTTIDSIRIIWPSGTNEYYTNQNVNAFYRITEGTGMVNLSVQNNEPGETVFIFPNPAQDLVQIKLPDPWLNKDLFLQLVDINGKVWQQKSFKGNTFISLSKQLNGIYFVRISDGNRVIVEKVIKQF